MKIIKIEELPCEKLYHAVFLVHLEPNWLERMFGCAPKVLKLRHNGYSYVKPDGTTIWRFGTIAETIDTWRRKWS